MSEKNKVTVVYKEHHEHEVKYWPYFAVWFALLVFTWLTIWIASIHLGHYAGLIALMIATIKVSLVMAIFMHLQHEQTVFKNIFAITIIIIALFIGFTFFDTALR